MEKDLVFRFVRFVGFRNDVLSKQDRTMWRRLRF